MNKLLIFLFLLTGCSSKQLYQFGQDYQKSQCIEYALTEQQYNDCVNMDKKSFEEYQKERKAIDNKP